MNVLHCRCVCECSPVLVCVCVCVKCAWCCWHCCLATMFSFFPLRKAFYCFFFFCFSAAGGWCHEQTRGILANKLDLPQYTPLRTHTYTHTHALNVPYGRNRGVQEEKGKKKNNKILSFWHPVVLWLPGFHRNPQHRQFQASVNISTSSCSSTSASFPL